MKEEQRPLSGETPQRIRCTATETILARAQRPHHTPFPVLVDLRYDTGDPYAVCLVLYCGERGAVSWFFARSLLADGTTRVVGDGDVTVSPVRDRGIAAARVTLRSATGSIDVYLPFRVLLRFLRKTDAMVQPGGEHHHLDLDDVVARLTGRS